MTTNRSEFATNALARSADLRRKNKTSEDRLNNE